MVRAGFKLLYILKTGRTLRGGLTSPNPIPAQSSSPQICESHAACAPPVRRHTKPGFLTPLTVSILGLAITVALWGYGYKLSLYDRHPGKSTDNLVAKLWIKERCGVASMVRAAAPTNRSQDSSAQPAPRLPIAVETLAAASPGFERRPIRSPIEFDLLSRPPPSSPSL